MISVASFYGKNTEKHKRSRILNNKKKNINIK